jgi:8-oxo-dGTP pyrophosphatase MutT (NUDIX family)
VVLDDVRTALGVAGRTLATNVGPPIAEWPGVPPREDATDNAVLLALFEEDGAARLVLERRSADLRRHRGEVALPGGRVDPGEAPIAAALREAHEEVGIPPHDVEVLGWLSPLRTYSGQSVIRPFVGVLAARPALRVQPAEVAYAFDVALADLLKDGVFREEQWHRGASSDGDDDGYVTIFVFEAAGEVIWGATARILAELCGVLAGTVAPAR